MRRSAVRRPSPATTTLAAILLAGLALRLWAIRHGLPYVYNPDEHFEVYRALRLGLGDFDYDRVTKGGYFYVLFVEFGIHYVLMRLAGVVNSAQQYARSIVADPSAIWTIGRATTAVVGTVNVFLVYRLGARASAAPAGLAAAAVLAASSAHVVNSQFITVDVPMTCLATAALYVALRIAEDGRRLHYVTAGALVALAAMTKLPGIVVVLPIVACHFLRPAGLAPGWLRPTIGKLTLFTVTFVVVYVAGNPGILWQFDSLVGGVFGLFAQEGWATHDLPLDVKEGPNPWRFYWGALTGGVGIPVLLFAAAGIALSVYEKRKPLIVLWAFAAAFYLILCLARDPNLIYPRYVLPMLPPIAVVTGYAIVRVASVLRHRAPIAVIATVLVVLPTLQRSIAHNVIHSRTDTRTLAKQWFDANVSPGSSVYMRGNPEVKSALPVPLESTVESLKRMADERRKDNPGKSRFLRMRAEVAKAPAYDVVTTRQTKPWPSWIEVRASGVEYVIMRHPSDGADRDLPAGQVARSRALFDRALNADPAVRLATTIDPAELRCPGPYLRIYRVTSVAR